jgi:rhodanese-related sulfurtransferase
VIRQPGPLVVDPTVLDERLRRREAVTVLDVRRPESWCDDNARIPGAAWIPHDEVRRRARDLPADRPLVVYCS